MHRPTRRTLLACGVAGLTTTAGCFAGEADEFPTGEGEATWPATPTWGPAEGSPLDAEVTATTAVENLSIPWDLTFAGGEALFTERTGGVRLFEAETLATETGLQPDDARAVLSASDLPDRTGPGEGGTLGLATHPEYPDPRALFVYYTAADDLRNRVVRYDIDADEVSVVVDGIPANDWHNGGRIEVGPNGHLWILAGDAQEGADIAQDPDSLGGAVLRVTLDGDPAPNNPDFGAGGDPRTYTLGHRNPQGLAFTPDGEPLVAEHGPLNRDEVSALRPGANYGWNVARGGPGGVQYNAYGEDEAFTPPLLNTGADTTWAPSGSTFYTGDAISAWHNRLFVAGLRSQTLFCMTLDADGAGPDGGRRFDADWLDDRYTATAHRLYDGEFGRLRHVEEGPDGALYLLTSNRDGRTLTDFPVDSDDRILRIEPT
ncbi:sorbosone dehydrogenase family protein [Natronomonas gomsonensis]|uniref:PQQ-dependent sugar dehydrogenase n=1 Tax=Natronomonas gomsonensis TaxID=1046043 RepID=UPI0015C0F35F|nr:PQQ-dependent sugar dehydrogenase [Natronomonas gomsonensis]